MRDHTNLDWPEAPFGADQRPYGRRATMLAAFTLDWAHTPDLGAVPVAAATVYLRVRRHGAATRVDDQTLSIGFRTVVVEHPDEVAQLAAVFDRALTRARRHAVVLAGHRLGEDLTRLERLSAVPLRGVAGVLDAWTHRTDTERGTALMVDTAADTGTAAGVDIDVPLDPLPAPWPQDPECAATVARTALARCLAIGLTAAVHTGRYAWDGTFRASVAVDHAAWDLLPATPPPTGDPTPDVFIQSPATSSG